MRSGLKHLLNRSFPACTVEEAADAATAMGKIGSEIWDLIIVDLDLPDRSGLDLLRDIQSLTPKRRALVLSGHDEHEFGKRVLQAGASGFIGKLSHNEEIVGAIRRILSGKTFISADLASTIVDGVLKHGDGFPHESLSEREFEVLRLLGRGNTVSETANKLGISVKTVSTYRSRILEKIGLRSTGEIVRYAVTHDLT